MKPTTKELLIFLEQINSDFIPTLTTKVNLNEFVEKIREKAVLICQRNTDNELVGLVVLYCNNTMEHKSYISLVGVLKDYRGCGIAKTMLNEAISYAKESGYYVLGIHSNNPIAIQLYKKLGFCIKENGERVYMEKILNENE